MKADGYHEIEKIITAPNVHPSLGYIMLANILLETDNKIVITTNFDRLTETALLTVFNCHAKVINHEKMLPIIAVDKKKPTVLKIHNDVFAQPKNDEGTVTSTLSPKWKETLDNVLNDYHLIVLGYGGNDREGLVQYLADWEKSNPNRIYWCYYQENKNVPTKIKGAGKKKEGCYQIKTDGFDEFMVALNAKLLEDKARGLESIQEHIESTAKKRIDVLNEQSLAAKGLKNFVAGSWVEVERQVRKETDNDKKEALYQQGIKQFPKSHELLGIYAIFLCDIRKDYDQAEQYYQKALKLDPEDATNNGNYALFLDQIRRDYDQAEGYYQKALKLDPQHATYNCNYAIFLKDILKEYDKAEKYYLKALELDPDSANNNGNYTGFLLAQGRKKESIALLQKAENNAADDSLKLELLFYRLAHFPESYTKNKLKLEQLLAKDVRSIGWNFEDNIAQAKKEGCTYVDELTQWAKVITTTKNLHE